MQDWIELETRFRALSPLAQYLRIDFQWGAAGEHWYVGGGCKPSVVAQFNGLAQVAGNLLKSVLPAEEQFQSVVTEPHSHTLWLRAMKEWSGAFQFLHHVQQISDAGEDEGSIYTGQTTDASQAAANLCLFLHSNYPLHQRPQAHSGMTVNNYVVNSQVGLLNAGEIHNVKNISANVGRLQERGQQAVAEAMSKLLEAVAASDEIEVEEKSTLLDQIEELSRQAVLQPNERAKPGVLKAVIAGLGTTLGAAGSLADIWSTWGPVIRTFFQF